MDEVSASGFLQCFDTVGWVTGKRKDCKKSVPVIPQQLEQMGGKNHGELTNPD